LAWLTSHGKLIGIGVEGIGSYGCGLMRHLRPAGISVVKVNVRIVNYAVTAASPTP
jgi:transposase